nr:unnamed protein product [Callosobruchus chinensis]
MEKCVNQELLKYLELHQLMNDRQYGFRHQRSTGDLLAYVIHVWNKLIYSFGEAHVVALDISMAFDQLWHVSLLNNKLPSYGLPVRLCDWFADFLFGRKITVMVDSFSSCFHNINAGIPQGSYCTLSNKRCPSELSVLMNNQALPRSHSFKLLRVSITENTVWHEHVSSIATAAGRKLRYLFRARKYFSPSNLLTLYKPR